jgi:hypothetical protein
MVAINIPFHSLELNLPNQDNVSDLASCRMSTYAYDFFLLLLTYMTTLITMTSCRWQVGAV